MASKTITKRKAISECKKLWAEIEESGLTKYGFLNSPDGKKWRAKSYHGNCPLCEYDGLDCSRCPLMAQYGKTCSKLGFTDQGHSTPEWFKAVRGLK